MKDIKDKLQSSFNGVDLFCTGCGEGNLHINRVESGGELNRWAGRPNLAHAGIDFFCEHCDHITKIEIEFHEGMCFLKVLD